MFEVKVESVHILLASALEAVKIPDQRFGKISTVVSWYGDQ